MSLAFVARNFSETLLKKCVSRSRNFFTTKSRRLQCNLRENVKGWGISMPTKIFQIVINDESGHAFVQVNEIGGNTRITAVEISITKLN